jgi:nucleotide sugar dehydrogenase
VNYKSATVIGLGKIGLPLAVKVSENVTNVYGLDISSLVVDQINSGNSPVGGEPDLDQKLLESINTGRLRATTNGEEAISRSEVVIVVVPLVVALDGEPDFRSIDAATAVVGQNIQKGTLVVYETTLPVGTTRQRFGKILERESSLKLGEDFFLAFSPERVSSGSVLKDLSAYPKLVGGVNEDSGIRAQKFYEQVLEFQSRPDLPRPNGVWNLGTSEAAELAKLLETTYRDVNIGLANQFADYARSINVNVYEVIEASNSQPYSHIHSPGISVGGHCIPVYPHFYLQGHPEATIVSEARQVNKSAPANAISQIVEAFGPLSGKKVAILGLAYRGGVKESAFSGTFDLVSEVKKHGGLPVVNDPLYSDLELEKLGLESFTLGEGCDVAILHTSHIEYRDLSPKDLKGCTLFFDGRNFAPEAIRSGMEYLSVVWQQK